MSCEGRLLFKGPVGWGHEQGEAGRCMQCANACLCMCTHMWSGVYAYVLIMWCVCCMWSACGNGGICRMCVMVIVSVYVMYVLLVCVVLCSDGGLCDVGGGDVCGVCGMVVVVVGVCVCVCAILGRTTEG